jgi:hypothetical protein
MSNRYRWLTATAAALAFTGQDARAVELTATERAWLHAARPVLAFAKQQGMPLDIIVQPQPTPGESPIGMAFVEGRCLLVLSMRENPEAQATLDRVAPDLLGPVVEAIAAHELGHCWRHIKQSWGKLPDSVPAFQGFSRVTHAQAELLKDMWRTRNEEGFADLVGLAWTLRHNPSRYEEVHAWNVRVRADQPIETGPHDTRAWVRLAANKAVFAASGSIFEQVEAVWLAGLLEGP